MIDNWEGILAVALMAGSAIFMITLIVEVL